MDLKQIEYIVKIAEENNITRAAEKLYITQSALNQQLLKLEKELGTPLFHRSRTNWHLTEAGEVYVRTAKEMLVMKRDTYDQIHDLANIQKGRLSVGFTPDRGSRMFSAVYPEFHRTHYGITIEPMELSVHAQQEMITSDDLDIGFMTIAENDKKPSHEYQAIVNEEIYLAIPKRHPISSDYMNNKVLFPVLDIRLLKEEPFVLMYKESTIRKLVDGIFENAGFEPQVLFETSSTNTILRMIHSEICCGLIPAFYVDFEDQDISYFSLAEKPSWSIVASYKKGRHLSRAAKDFIKLSDKYWKSEAYEKRSL